MPDEENFDRFLQNANIFSLRELRLFIYHPTLPGCFIEIDNAAQKDTTPPKEDVFPLHTY